MTRIFRGNIPAMQTATPTIQAHRSSIAKAFALCTALCCTFTASIAHSADYRLTAADVTAIQALARTLFEAGRDGSAERLRTVIPTREEYLAFFSPICPCLRTDISESLSKMCEVFARPSPREPTSHLTLRSLSIEAFG